MRKIAIFFMLFLPSVLMAEARWTPSMALSVMYMASSYEDSRNEIPIWSSAVTEAELSVMNMTVDGRHRIAAPITLSYISDSGYEGRMRIPGAFAGALSLQYGFRATDTLEISAGADAYILYHVNQNAVSWRFGGSLALTYFPFSHIGIAIPVKAIWSKDAMHFTAGASLRILLGGAG